MTRQLSKSERRFRLAAQRHSEERIRNGGCAPGYDGPCMGPTAADYAWADKQFVAVYGADVSTQETTR